ncbi:MAG: hypothetical protein M3R24_26400 [Chloroflexota bacterium]|nr:hypothetical protein [Chloroflexota bacterium]
MRRFVTPVRTHFSRTWKHVSPYLRWFKTLIELLELLEFIERLVTLLQHYPFC